MTRYRLSEAANVNEWIAERKWWLLVAGVLTD